MYDTNVVFRIAWAFSYQVFSARAWEVGLMGFNGLRDMKSACVYRWEGGEQTWIVRVISPRPLVG